MTSTHGSKKIPVTLLTGFLGSGKSTLLSNLLIDERFENTAVVVNEFGATGLDGLLIQHAEKHHINDMKVATVVACIKFFIFSTFVKPRCKNNKSIL